MQEVPWRRRDRTPCRCRVMLLIYPIFRIMKSRRIPGSYCPYSRIYHLRGPTEMIYRLERGQAITARCGVRGGSSGPSADSSAVLGASWVSWGAGRLLGRSWGALSVCPGGCAVRISLSVLLCGPWWLFMAFDWYLFQLRSEIDSWASDGL